MSMDRRKFLKLAGVAAGTTAVASTGVCATVKSASGPASEAVGCLADTTLCIGCRQCEIACNTRNKLPKGDSSLADRTFSNKERRPTDIAFTVVNEYPGKPSPDQPHVKKTFAKVQCMHCLTPACVSACIVG
ncbi:MAG: 4Fe-4S ferredoxin, partial [bacterium]